MVIGLSRLSISSSWCLRNCSVFFFYIVIFMIIQLYAVFLSFNSCTIWNDISYFIPDVGNMCSIFVSLARGLSNLLIFFFFWRTNFLFPWVFFSVMFSYFQFYFLLLFHSFCLFWVYCALFSSFWMKEFKLYYTFPHFKRKHLVL